MTKRIISMLLITVMMFTIIPSSAFAVTESQIAEDGEYTSAYLYGYKKGELKYRADLTVGVENGLISTLSISNCTSDKLYKAFTPQLISAYTDIPASVSYVEAVEADSGSGFDAVSSASVKSSYSKSAKYSVNLKEAIIDALSNAPVKETSLSGEIYSGSAKVNNYDLTMNVTVLNDTIVDIEADKDKSTGSWETLVTNLKSSYVGKHTDSIDAVTGATPYTTAVNTAVLDALSSANASAQPKILEGENQTWTKGSGKKLRFKSSSEFINFLKLLIDSREVSNAYYTTKSGSTIVEVDSSFLETLAAGEHTVSIVSTDGTASTKFTVKSSGSSSESISDGTYTDEGAVKGYYNNSTIPATVSITVSNGQFGNITASTTATFNKDQWTLEDTIKIFADALTNREATVAAISSVTFSSSSSWADEQTFSDLKQLLLSAVGGTSEDGDTIKTYTGNGSSYDITIEVGETIRLISSYSNSSYRQWTTSEWDGDEQLYTDDQNESGNTIEVVGKAEGLQTYKYYGQWLSTNDEVFNITVVSSSTPEEPEEDEEDLPVPDHVKSISGSGDDYTISLNVTGKDVTSSSTTTTQGSTVNKGTNLVMVIDISGSIVGKESALNSAIRSLVNGLPDSSQVGVVTFNESAAMSKVYSKNTISGLNFSGVEDSGTNMATGISAAATLLNGSGWTNSDNNKAMVIISDFDIADYANSINGAKTAKNAKTTIYSVKIDSNTVGEASLTELSSDNKNASIPSVTRYISSEYPNASAVNNSMLGMFNQATVTTGTKDSDKTYVYGAGGGNWSEIFAEIQETQQITTVTETTVHTNKVIIEDVLSDYVDFSGTGTNFGITVDGLTSSQYTVEVSGQKATVTFSPTFELNADSVYTVKIPVKPTEAAQAAAHAAASNSVELPTNNGASLSYAYGDNDVKTVPYAETPVITVSKEFTHTLSYDANGGDNAPAEQTVTNKANSVEFHVSTAAPTKENCDFIGWAESENGEVKYYANDPVTVSLSKTLYAVWQTKTAVVTWKNDDGTVLETDENVLYGTMPEYNGETPTKAATAEKTYTFAGWDKEIAAVTGDVTYTATFTDDTNTYTVKFVHEDGTELQSEVLAYGTMPEYKGETPIKAATAEKTYTFAGWDKEIAAVTGDVTYTATFTDDTNTYTVKFVNEDGTELQSEVLAYGTMPEYKGETPIKADDEIYSYTFTEWDKELTAVTENITYTAVYTQNQTAFRVFIDDYSKGKADIDGVVSGNYYRGEVKFTVSADQAIAFGIDNKDNTYTRMYCEEKDNRSYEFFVNVTDHDVYLVDGFKGDADLNGKVQLRDASKIANHMIDVNAINDPLNLFIGDADANGKIQLKDSSRIANYMVDMASINWDLNTSDQ